MRWLPPPRRPRTTRRFLACGQPALFWSWACRPRTYASLRFSWQPGKSESMHQRSVPGKTCGRCSPWLPQGNFAAKRWRARSPRPMRHSISCETAMSQVESSLPLSWTDLGRNQSPRRRPLHLDRQRHHSQGPALAQHLFRKSKSFFLDVSDSYVILTLTICCSAGRHLNS